MKLEGLIILLWLSVSTWAVHYKPNWESLESRPLPTWFDQAKVGIFIHWGVFSVPSLVSEWFWERWHDHKSEPIVNYMQHYFKPNFTYAEFAPQFTAEFYDPHRWAKIIKKSGAKYAVLTTKHHEGFTLWPSKYSFQWNAMDVGPRRDLVGDFCKAIRASGLHLGLYHSLMEWYHPLMQYDQKNHHQTQEFVRLKAMPELYELVNTYKPDLIWSDGMGGGRDSYWNSTHFLAWLYNESPVSKTVVVNDRWGTNTKCKHGGYLSCGDRFQPTSLFHRKFESAITIDRHSWGFRRDANLHDYLTIEKLLAHLVPTIAFGGNILINIGPTKDGTISAIFEERLGQLGEWLEVNGEAIYSSQAYHRENCQKDNHTEGVYYTQKGKHTVYGISLKWPKNNHIDFGCVEHSEVSSVSVLGASGVKVHFEQGQHGTLVHLPRWTPNSQLRYAYTVKFTLKS